MLDYLIALIIFPALLMGWLVVQNMSRRFAAAYPQFGPAREEGGGCGKNCGCSGKTACKNERH